MQYNHEQEMSECDKKNGMNNILACKFDKLYEITQYQDLNSFHQHTTDKFYRLVDISLTHGERILGVSSEISSADILQELILSRRETMNSPICVSDGKIKMKLNDMIKNAFYQIEYKNKKYMIGISENGIVDIYKTK